MKRADRLAGGLYGLLVGDALGVPYEFRLAHDIPDLPLIDFEPPEGYARAHSGVPAGTWSDDGAQALCLLASLLHCNGLDVADLGNRFVNWWSHGYMAVDGRVFDIGIQTTDALMAIAGGADARHAGGVLEHENGNGSLMRALPLALYLHGSDIELVKAAEAQSRITHGHLRSRVLCGVYVLWARRELAGTVLDLPKAVDAYAEVVGNDPKRLEEAHRVLIHGEGSGTGYVLDSLCSAATALRQPTYEGIVKHAVAMGNDTDTTACIAGGIAGIRHGVDGIPSRWRRTLRGHELVEPLLAKLRRLRT